MWCPTVYHLRFWGIVMSRCGVRLHYFPELARSFYLFQYLPLTTSSLYQHTLLVKYQQSSLQCCPDINNPGIWSKILCHLILSSPSILFFFFLGNLKILRHYRPLSHNQQLLQCYFKATSRDSLCNPILNVPQGTFTWLGNSLRLAISLCSYS